MGCIDLCRFFLFFHLFLFFLVFLSIFLLFLSNFIKVKEKRREWCYGLKTSFGQPTKPTPAPHPSAFSSAYSASNIFSFLARSQIWGRGDVDVWDLEIIAVFILFFDVIIARGGEKYCLS